MLPVSASYRTNTSRYSQLARDAKATIGQRGGGLLLLLSILLWVRCGLLVIRSTGGRYGQSAILDLYEAE